MAGFNRRRDYVTTTGHSQQIISGNFNCNGTSAISNLVGTGTGWSASRIGVGNYSISFVQPMSAIYSVDCGIISATALQTVLTQPIPSAVTNGGFQITNSSATGTAVEIAAGQGVQFQVAAAISSLTK